MALARGVVPAGDRDVDAARAQRRRRGPRGDRACRLTTRAGRPGQAASATSSRRSRGASACWRWPKRRRGARRSPRCRPLSACLTAVAVAVWRWRAARRADDRPRARARAAGSAKSVRHGRRARTGRAGRGADGPRARARRRRGERGDGRSAHGVSSSHRSCAPRWSPASPGRWSRPPGCGAVPSGRAGSGALPPSASPDAGARSLVCA